MECLFHEKPFAGTDGPGKQARGRRGGATTSKEKGTMRVGVDTVPVLPTDPGDRNRTSPF